MIQLTADEANQRLRQVAMEIGAWKQITDIPGRQLGKRDWKNYQAPKNALLNFSHHVFAWLPAGHWKIVQVDNSTGWIDPVQNSLLGGLLYGSDETPDLNRIGDRCFLFEFGGNKNANENTDLLIANLIFLFLFFELHAYVVSSGSNAGELLGIQDGFVYFSSREKSLSEADVLINNFAQNPTEAPQWIKRILAGREPA